MATLRSYSATFEQNGLTSAAVARYRFNEGSGTDALDSIGGLDGTYEPGAAPGAPGWIGDGAASFNGSTGIVLVEAGVTEPLLLPNGAFEMWFTIDDLGQQQQLFSKDSADHMGGEVAAVVDTSGRLVFALSDGPDVFTARSATGTVVADTPTHLVANFGSDGMHVFIDGVEVATNAYTGGLDAGLGNFDQLVIGAGNNSAPGMVDGVNSFFGGTIDEFAFYDRALSGGEVQQLFNGGEFGTTVVGTADADTIIGGSDNEELRGAGGDDSIAGNDGDDELRGGSGGDLVQGGAGADDLSGGRGDDELRGGSGDDQLSGGGGNDHLFGNRGGDELRGGVGDDLLNGGLGDDLLNGGLGTDALSGGSGSDTFRTDQIGHGVDQILDFAAGPGGDVLDLSEVVDFGAGDDVADFVRLEQANGNTQVAVDANGGGDSFTAVFNLVGATGLDVGTLVDDGNLQVTSTPS